MACPREQNKQSKKNEKIKKYQQLCFKPRERQQEFKVKVLTVTVVVGRCDCGMKRAIRKLSDEKMVDKLANEMRKSVLRESETALKKLYWD